MRGLSLLLLLTLGLVWPVDAQKRDFSAQYRPGHRVLVDTRREGDSLRVYLRFSESSDLLRQGQPLRITAWPTYDARRPLWTDTVRNLARRIRPDEQGGARVEFCLPVSRLTSGTVLSMACADPEAAGTAAWLPITPARLTRPFVLTDTLGAPLLRHHIRVGEPFFVDRYGPEQPVLVRRYATPFVAALPPHADPARQSGAAPTLAISDSLAFRAGRLVMLQETGLYTLRLASEKAVVGVLVTEAGYPNLTTADELIQPLVYLTTSAERRKLYEAPNPKRAVDQFWLDAAVGQPTIARQAIRTYYGRAQAANELFAAHKAGWMTDRGMLYMALGPPDAVYRTTQEERWVYHNTDKGAASSYTFRPKPSTFAPQHYELVRRPEYERLWYAAVEQWRKATTTAPGR